MTDGQSPEQRPAWWGQDQVLATPSRLKVTPTAVKLMVSKLGRERPGQAEALSPRAAGPRF